MTFAMVVGEVISGSRISRILSTESCGLAEDPDQGQQRDQAREDRQHRVVGQRRGQVRAAVVAELAVGPLEHEQRLALGRERGSLVSACFASPSVLLSDIYDSFPSDGEPATRRSRRGCRARRPASS